MEPKRCYGCMNIKTGSPFCEHCGYDERTTGAPHQLRAGTVLRDKYLVGRVLGQGGFGITYLGWDIDLNIPVAIKEYYPSGVVMRESTSSPTVTVVTGGEDTRFEENRNRFLREAQTLARLEDVSEVVQIKNYFAENNTAYIVMGYVKGITLKEYIRSRGGFLSVEECFRLLRPLMEAMDQVHALGLVHRDISPDNIMLQPNGRTRLIDFGAAHEASGYGDGKSTQAVLKHGFAPVEQYQNKGRLGPWTDVYAMCATIYYCLTGIQPPHATDRMMGEDAFDWDSIPGLTWQQRQTLKMGVEIHYNNRIQSMSQLCYGLFSGGVVAPPPVTGNEAPPEQPSWEQPAVRTVERTGGKRKSRVGLIVTVIVLVCALIIGGAVAALGGGASLRDVSPGGKGGSSETGGESIKVKSDLTNLSLEGKTSGKTGKDYSATLVPENGCALPEEITVKVDGSKLSDKKYTYDPESGELTIPGKEITGDIEIIAEAVEPTVVGEWKGSVDMTDMLTEELIGSDPELAPFFSFSDMTFDIYLELNENGTCTIRADQASADVLVKKMQEQIVDGMYAYLENMIEEYGYDMTTDEFLEVMGYDPETFADELIPADEFREVFADLSESGTYEIAGGMLHFTLSDFSAYGNTYTLRGNKLTIEAAGDEDEMSKILFPLVLERVG